MILKLIWKDLQGNCYYLADLKKENNIFVLDIKEDGLKKAIRKGCYGIGNLEFLKYHYESEELFQFFKERIPKKDDLMIDYILKKYNLEKYDEMKLLEKTKGLSNNDRYFLEVEYCV